MSCNIGNTEELAKISTLFFQGIQVDYTSRRYGIRQCKPVLDFEDMYDILNLYTRALEKDKCKICDESYCCTSQLEEQINTL